MCCFIVNKEGYSYYILIKLYPKRLLRKPPLRQHAILNAVLFSGVLRLNGQTQIFFFFLKYPPWQVFT